MSNTNLKSGQAIYFGQPMRVADAVAKVDELVAETDATIAAHPHKAKQPKDIADIDSNAIYDRWNGASAKAEAKERRKLAKPKTLDDLVAPAFAKWNGTGGDHGQVDD